MKLDRTDLLLDLIREAAGNARAFLGDLDRDAFLADTKARHAVAMCLIIVGENVSRLSKHHPDFLDAYPNTPWREPIGLRNRIAHGYVDVDFEIVWQTAAEYLPKLIRELPDSRPLEDE